MVCSEVQRHHQAAELPQALSDKDMGKDDGVVTMW